VSVSSYTRRVGSGRDILRSAERCSMSQPALDRTLRTWSWRRAALALDCGTARASNNLLHGAVPSSCAATSMGSAAP
jgi:hypothetical protein